MNCLFIIIIILPVLAGLIFQSSAATNEGETIKQRLSKVKENARQQDANKLRHLTPEEHNIKKFLESEQEETKEQKLNRLKEKDRERKANKLRQLTPEEHQKFLQSERERKAIRLSLLTPEQLQEHRNKDKKRKAESREKANLKKLQKEAEISELRVLIFHTSAASDDEETITQRLSRVKEKDRVRNSNKLLQLTLEEHQKFSGSEQEETIEQKLNRLKEKDRERKELNRLRKRTERDKLRQLTSEEHNIKKFSESEQEETNEQKLNRIKENNKKRQANWLSQLTPEKRQELRDKVNKRRANWFSQLTPEERQEYRENAKRRQQKWLNQLTPEKRQKHRENANKRQAEYYERKKEKKLLRQAENATKIISESRGLADHIIAKQKEHVEKARVEVAQVSPPPVDHSVTLSIDETPIYFNTMNKPTDKHSLQNVQPSQTSAFKIYQGKPGENNPVPSDDRPFPEKLSWLADFTTNCQIIENKRLNNLERGAEMPVIRSLSSSATPQNMTRLLKALNINSAENQQFTSGVAGATDIRNQFASGSSSSNPIILGHLSSADQKAIKPVIDAAIPIYGEKKKGVRIFGKDFFPEPPTKVGDTAPIGEVPKDPTKVNAGYTGAEEARQKLIMKNRSVGTSPAMLNPKAPVNLNERSTSALVERRMFMDGTRPVSIAPLKFNERSGSAGAERQSSDASSQIPPTLLNRVGSTKAKEAFSRVLSVEGQTLLANKNKVPMNQLQMSETFKRALATEGQLNLGNNRQILMEQVQLLMNETRSRDAIAARQNHPGKNIPVPIVQLQSMNEPRSRAVAGQIHQRNNGPGLIDPAQVDEAHRKAAAASQIHQVQLMNEVHRSAESAGKQKLQEIFGRPEKGSMIKLKK